MASGGAGDLGSPMCCITDSLMGDIHRFGGHQLLDDQADLGRRLSRVNFSRDADDLKAVARGLRRLRDPLRKEAVDNGWEVE
jgi:hypothetical protein